LGVLDRLLFFGCGCPCPAVQEPAGHLSLSAGIGVARFFSLARQIDPKTEWSGHVLSLHGLGVQWTVTGDRFGGHLLFIPANPSLSNPHQEMLQEQLTTLCRTLVMPKRRIRWFWGMLTFGLLFLAIGLLITDIPVIVQQFGDYWM